MRNSNSKSIFEYVLVVTLAAALGLVVLTAVAPEVAQLYQLITTSFQFG